MSPASPTSRAGSLDELLDACSQARGAATDAIARGQAMVAQLQRTCADALTRRLDSRAHLLYARVEGLVDGRSVRAVVRTDGQVVADPDLLRRAQVLVALGETFGDGHLHAELGGGVTASALTLMRGCDQLLALELRSGRHLQGAPRALGPE